MDVGRDHEEGNPVPSVVPVVTPDLSGAGLMAPLPISPNTDRSVAPPTFSARALSVLWALVPIATLGWGAPFSFTYTAIRLHSKALGWCAGAYGVLATGSFYLAGNNNDNSWQSNAGAAIAVATGCVGTGQAFAIRKRLLGGRSEGDSAVARATEQLRLRKKARQILAANPGLAHELQIGTSGLTPWIRRRRIDRCEPRTARLSGRPARDRPIDRRANRRCA